MFLFGFWQTVGYSEAVQSIAVFVSQVQWFG